MAIFFHVSTDLNHNGIFVPRIPANRHRQAEDDKIPRISVAPTIEDCLTAIPGGGSSLDELNIELRGYYRIFRIDTEKLGIQNEHIVNSKTLYENDFVRDADVTNEHWITTPFSVPQEDSFIIKLISWEETCADVVPYTIYEIADEHYDGNYLRAYEEQYQEAVPCAIKIQDAHYISEEVEKDTLVSIYFDDDYEKERILSYLVQHYDVIIETEYMDEIEFRPTKKVNLRDLFIYHRNVLNLNSIY